MGGIMKDQLQDAAAAATTISSPAWVYYLSQVNVVLTFVSLALGIAFVIWRWRRGS
jgi:hypothetical protein